MSDWNLDVDEGIILETNGVYRVRNGKNTFLRKMLLTNKNIIFVTSQRTGGIFSKSVDVVDKTPLSEVKVINGQVFVSQKKRDIFDYILQIQFYECIEEYSYNEGSKKITNQWVDELGKLLGNGQVQSSSKKSKASSTAYQEKKQTQPSGGFCVNCGTRLAPGVKFCPECGFPVGNTASSAPNILPVPMALSKNPETGKMEFAGVVVKCPNCGQHINNFDVVCPSCGHQITGRVASSSVQNLQYQLMAIENSRQQKTTFGYVMRTFGFDGEESEISSKKVTLINSFPIPNTIEEISEFVILAAGNINVALSKESFGNNLGRSFSDNNSYERSVSDAWMRKL